MRTLRQIFTSFPAARESGLTAEQARQSVTQFGANRLTPLPREPLWKKFLEKFDEPIIKILLAAALLSMIVDLFQKASTTLGAVGLALVVVSLVGASIMRLGQWIPSIMFGLAITLLVMGIAAGHPTYEGLAVMIAVVLATGVAFASEYKSDREFEILNAQKDSLRVKVQRDGTPHTVPLEDVVVGDLVLLEMGDEIPADGRVVKATELFVDQSLMTGESEAVRKLVAGDEDATDGPDQAGCVYRGTQVIDGAGQMIVTEVGDGTMIGQIAKRLSSEGDEEEEGGEEEQPATAEARVQKKLTISKELTPLQLKLTNLADLISKVGYIAAVLIFAAMIIRAVLQGGIHWPGAEEDFTTVMVGNLREVLQAFVYMVIIIVVAVPEGLPMSVTVSLALAMQKMTRANSLVRQLVACETVGSATVICSDKTGTLTQNKMTVVRLAYDGKVFDKGGDWPKPGTPEAIRKPVDWLALNAAVNSTANLEEKEGKLLSIGNSTEGSLLQWLHDNGIAYAKLRSAYPVLYQIHFSSDRKRMTTVVRHNGELVTLVKGAPEVLLEQCKHFQTSDGQMGDLTPELRQAIMAQLRDAASNAMRTLAFAYAKLPADFPATEDEIHIRREDLERRLVYTGFVAIRDPLRDDVKEAIDNCRTAGIEVKMITGDNIETARAIGKDIGLLADPNAIAMTSAEFNAKSDDEIKAILPNLRILARARPLDKFRIVKLLQEQNQVVAVTGDGTNDAPALKKADVGLAMGIAGTEVAKEASKIVLLDDSFSTIVKAVHWGRSLYENIQRFIQFQLTINVSALTIAFLGPVLFDIRPPFTVLQLLWINVIMDTFAAIALCSEPPRAGLMRVKPKRRDESILTPGMLRTIFITASFFVVAMFALLLGMKYQGWFAEGGSTGLSEEFAPLTTRQVSIFFSVYVFFQVWNQINCRSLSPETSGLTGLFRNPTFLMIASTIVVVQVLIVSIPFLASIFKVEPLALTDWLWIAAGTSSVLLFAEIARRVRLALKTG